MADLQWHYASGGQKHGPVSAASLHELLSSGTVTTDALVWNRTMKAWTPASQVPEFADVAMTPPPIPESLRPTTTHPLITAIRAKAAAVATKIRSLPRLAIVGLIVGGIPILLISGIALLYALFGDHRSTWEQINDSNRARNADLNERARKLRESYNP